MTHYLAYWRPSTVREILARPRELLNHAASNQDERVKSGDTVWIVTAWPGGRLVLLGRVPVNEVGDRPAMRRLGVKDLWKAPELPEHLNPTRSFLASRTGTSRPEVFRLARTPSSPNANRGVNHFAVAGEAETLDGSHARDGNAASPLRHNAHAPAPC
jgi:hypothetical protein